jgi:hypothetical protein
VLSSHLGHAGTSIEQAHTLARVRHDTNQLSNHVHKRRWLNRTRVVDLTAVVDAVVWEKAIVRNINERMIGNKLECGW